MSWLGLEPMVLGVTAAAQVAWLDVVVLAMRRERPGLLQMARRRHSMAMGAHSHLLHPLVTFAQLECGVMPLAGPALPPHIPLMEPFAVAPVSVVPFCVLGGGGLCCHGTCASHGVMGPAPSLFPCWPWASNRLSHFFPMMF